MRIELDAETMTLRSFGAVGDGQADDTGACQAAADWVRSGRSLVAEPGVYRITDTIDLSKHGGAASNHSVHFRGVSTGASGPHPSVILWDGPADRPAVRLWARDSAISGVAFRAATGATLLSAVDVSKARDGVMVTNVRFERVQVFARADGPHGGDILKGVTVGTSPQSNTNLEHFYASDCYFINCLSAGYAIESNQQQAKSHVFDRCHFQWQATAAPTGTAIDVLRGSVQTYDCEFHRMERALWIGGAVDSVWIQKTDSEWCKRLLELRTVSPENHLPVVLAGGRYDLSGLELETPSIAAADGRYVKHGMQGSLVVEGCTFRKGLEHRPTFSIAGTYGTQVVSRGNLYPTDAPFSGDINATSAGDSAINAAGEMAPLDWT